MKSNKNPQITAKIRKQFQTSCHKAVILAYKAMSSNPLTFKQWKENKISRRLLHEMKKLAFLTTKNIIVGLEASLDDDEIIYGDKEAEEADRIDFIFSHNWMRRIRLEYHGEAKNLSLKTWKKTDGARVDASNYRGRYITTGIERLIFGKYSTLNGFLIAYIVNGSAKENSIALNKLIQKRRLLPEIGLIENQKSIANYTKCYISKNIKADKEVFLQHIFLEFDK